MRSIGYEYGSWLGQMEWTHLSTIRTHYPQTVTSSETIVKRLYSDKNIKGVFFAIEKDRDYKTNNMSHMHVMVNSKKNINRNDLAKALGVNNKAVGYFQEIIDSKAVGVYCAKEIKAPFSHYNIYC
jgi:hypothetical protein